MRRYGVLKLVSGSEWANLLPSWLGDTLWVMYGLGQVGIRDAQGG